jgi:hypothetical protein
MASTRELQESIREGMRRQPETVACESRRLWLCLARELRAIIGDSGFQALYLRCVHLTRAEFDWLPDGIDPYFDKLSVSLDSVAASHAADGASALLQTFCNTLIELIGEPLTTKILTAAWHEYASGKGAKEGNNE